MKEQSSLQLDSQLCFALYSTSLAVVNTYKPLLAKLDLTYSQYLVMLILWEGDNLALKDVCARLGQKPGAITPVVKRLESIGYVSRSSNELDERSILIRLTEKGLRLKDEAERVKIDVYHQMNLSHDQQQHLSEQLLQLRQTVSV